MQDFYKFLLEKKSTSVVDKYNITSRGKNSSGLDADKGIWYGWSHRAICGFKIGDMLFDPKCDEKLNFNKRGTIKIKTLDQAKQAAETFSSYVS